MGFFWFYTFNYYEINNVIEYKLISKIFSETFRAEISFLIYIFLFIIISNFLFKYLNFLKIRIVFYSFIVTFVSFDIFKTLPHYYFYLNYKPILNFNMPEKIKDNIDRKINFPNVYFLIPDSMPSAYNYKKIFLEDFEINIEEEFEKLGFQFNKNVIAHGLDSYTSIPYFFYGLLI